VASMRRRSSALFAGVCAAALGSPTAMAGPPYVTDDPEPVEYRHWELYLASLVEHDTDGWTGTSPHVEVNYGAVPDVQLHLIAPLAFAVPAGQRARLGPGDTEIGVKWRFLQETQTVPQIGTFPLLEAPTGMAHRDLVLYNETKDRTMKSPEELRPAGEQAARSIDKEAFGQGHIAALENGDHGQLQLIADTSERVGRRCDCALNGGSNNAPVVSERDAHMQVPRL
jgi:hypothetical protein